MSRDEAFDLRMYGSSSKDMARKFDYPAAPATQQFFSWFLLDKNRISSAIVTDRSSVKRTSGRRVFASAMKVKA